MKKTFLKNLFAFLAVVCVPLLFVDGSWRARDPNSTASADTYNGIVDNGEYFAYKMIIQYPGYQWTWM